jgi:hypothetical protein
MKVTLAVISHFYVILWLQKPSKLALRSLMWLMSGRYLPRTVDITMYCGAF